MEFSLYKNWFSINLLQKKYKNFLISLLIQYICKCTYIWSAYSCIYPFIIFWSLSKTCLFIFHAVFPLIKSIFNQFSTSLKKKSKTNLLISLFCLIHTSAISLAHLLSYSYNFNFNRENKTVKIKGKRGRGKVGGVSDEAKLKLELRCQGK